MRSGFTLIEVLVTLAIVSLFTMASMGVVARLTRDQVTAGERIKTTSSREAIRRLLEADVVHADRFRNLADGVELKGCFAITASGLRVEHVPATVRYQIRRVDRASWLVRIQQTGDGEPFVERVSGDVYAVRLIGRRRDTNAAPNSADIDIWRDVGAVMNVDIAGESGKGVAFAVLTGQGS